MWNDSESIMEIYDKVNSGRITFPAICPVCKNQTAHLYIHKHNKNHSGIWAWCSKCGASAHTSAKTPIWWENPDFIDASKLCANPDYLNSLADSIDQWVTSHVPIDGNEFCKSFVMENKFNVCFKESYSTITAGAIGTLVIKDDFKSLSVYFIDCTGKKVKVNIPPEKLTKIVDVIE